jgi:hypothetical protein
MYSLVKPSLSNPFHIFHSFTVKFQRLVIRALASAGYWLRFAGDRFQRQSAEERGGHEDGGIKLSCSSWLILK